jgi:hypothetical protein
VARTGNGHRLPLPWREYGYGRSTR